MTTNLFDPQPFATPPGIPTHETCTAAPVGTGPAGETCKTCKHFVRHQYRNNIYLKCGKMEYEWTHGPGSDIRANWPACREWEAK